MRYFPHILRTVRMGRTRVLPIRPVLHDARNLPAPIISVIIGLPLPVFATACILLPVACPLLQPARCSSLPAALPVLPALPFQPACLPPACHLPATCPPLCRSARSACSSQSACPPPALPAPASQPACLQKKARLSKVSLFYYPVWAFVSPPRLSARQSRKPSRTSCSRILAQSATGCFSPSTNRSGHPRLQSSM